MLTGGGMRVCVLTYVVRLCRLERYVARSTSGADLFDPRVIPVTPARVAPMNIPVEALYGHRNPVSRTNDR